MSRCINCGLKTIKFKGTNHLEGIPRQVLAEWISPIMLSEEHIICTECDNLVTSSEIEASRRLGHSFVCVSCGVSLLTKRSHNIGPDIAEIIRTWSGEHALTDNGNRRICRACSLRAKRAITKQNPVAPAAVLTSQRNSNEIETNISSEAQSGRIVLGNYRRLTAGVAGKCSVDECVRQGGAATLSLRHDLMRRRVYVPPAAPVCARHRRDLNPDTVAKNTFTADQIADMLFLMKGYTPVDFSNVETMDSCLRKQWMGVSWEQFSEILQQTPALQRVEESSLLLALYLTKRYTSENEVVLASLFQMSEKELKSKLQLATECLELSADATDANIEDKN